MIKLLVFFLIMSGQDIRHKNDLSGVLVDASSSRDDGTSLFFAENVDVGQDIGETKPLLARSNFLNIGFHSSFELLVDLLFGRESAQRRSRIEHAETVGVSFAMRLSRYLGDFDPESESISRRSPGVFDLSAKRNDDIAKFVRVGYQNFFDLEYGVGSDLSLADFSGHLDSIPRSFIGLPGQKEGDEQQDRTNADEYCGIERVVTHVLRGRVHRACGVVHTLLGSKVFYLPLAGFFLAALAGIGGGLILDNFNRERQRVRTGWFLLFVGLPLSGLCLLLGLP
ncbi:hypothetical protein Wenmar_01532 [Wenxinia marina DSM 24838]|uniref:Uncharacterized protein n=1 Tax=Wenxinia marina DSM 24838 TaxID=1123501 RepID=A0A0D0QCB0_9RHOB|nr:hypothetical protein Wenmar_01532 [Wenxinia marina DSM 24838]